MKKIPTPTKFEKQEIGDNKYQFVIEPFYPGYGTTIGNALRRVLLSSLPGAAITAVKIKGVDHEFSTLPNVKEDVVDIILNLKKVRVKVEVETDEPIKIFIRVNKEKEVKAGDFEKQAGVEITNPELKICTVTDLAGDFEIEAWVEKGRGYLPVEMRVKKEKEIGVIEIDSLFSPVRQVGFRIENVRVGEMTNFDRVIIEVETDGTIECQTALEESLKILIDQYNNVLDQVLGKETVSENLEQIESETTVSEHDVYDTSNKNMEDQESKKLNEAENEIPESISEEPGKQPKKKRGRPKKIVDNN